MSFGGVGLLARRDSAAEQKGEGRLVFGLEGGEAFGLRCLAGFDFDGDRAPFMFAKEFHFGPALPPTRRVPTKGVEFLRDEIFRMVAFVGTVVLPQYVAHGQAADGSQQAGVEEEEFEKIFLRVRGKGEKAAIDDRVPEHETRSLQPIDRPDDPLVAPQSGYGFLEGKLRRGSALVAAQLGGDVLPKPLEVHGVLLAAVLGHVREVACRKPLLDFSDLRAGAPDIGPQGLERGNRLGHAPHREIHGEFPPKQTMHGLARRVPCSETLKIRRQGGIRPRKQEFLEGHRSHFQFLDLADRIRDIGQMHSQQRACRADRKGWHLLGKIFQRGQRTGAFLNLIKNQKVQRIDGMPLHQGKLLQNATRLQRALEDISKLGILFEVDDVASWKCTPSELIQRIGLPNLTSPQNKEGFALRPRSPLLQRGFTNPFHAPKIPIKIKSGSKKLQK